MSIGFFREQNVTSAMESRNKYSSWGHSDKSYEEKVPVGCGKGRKYFVGGFRS